MERLVWLLLVCLRSAVQRGVLYFASTLSKIGCANTSVNAKAQAC